MLRIRLQLTSTMRNALKPKRMGFLMLKILLKNHKIVWVGRDFQRSSSPAPLQQAGIILLMNFPNTLSTRTYPIIIQSQYFHSSKEVKLVPT